MKNQLLLVAMSLLLLACNSSNSYDLIIRNGSVYDGTGTSAIVQDIAIQDGKIVKVGKAIRGTSTKELDAKGLAVSPGFIDVHTHAEPLPLMPQAESHLRQGVTTSLGGPDGGCPLPIGAYLDSLAKQTVGINIAYLVGHNTVRNHIMGLENRAPTPAELDSMKNLIEKSMLEGAFGISTGLKYLPGTYAKLDEVVTLSQVAAQHGGIYTSHLREEGLGLLDGVGEAIQIAEQAYIPVVLTHHKVVGAPMWGSSTKTLSMVDAARTKGLNIMIDQYPYTASFTSLSILIPAWSMADDRYEGFARRCQDPILRDSIKRGIVHNLINDRGGNDLKRVQFSSFDWKPEFDGKTLYDWAVAEGLEPTMENGAELIIQAQIHRGARCIFHAMAEEDVERIMQHPHTMVASDGRYTALGKGHPHPRNYGTFPRVLGHFVREKQVLKLEEAIRKMTSLPANLMGLTDRGKIAEGQYADITVFDPETVSDEGSFTDPHHYPTGIKWVIVNGEVTVEGEKYIDVRAGMVLRGPAYTQ